MKLLKSLLAAAAALFFGFAAQADDTKGVYFYMSWPDTSEVTLEPGNPETFCVEVSSSEYDASKCEWWLKQDGGKGEDTLLTPIPGSNGLACEFGTSDEDTYYIIFQLSDLSPLNEYGDTQIAWVVTVGKGGGGGATTGYQSVYAYVAGVSKSGSNPGGETASSTMQDVVFTKAGLPNGLTFNQSYGILSGTPTETGTFGFTVYGKDSLPTPGADGTLFPAYTEAELLNKGVGGGVFGGAYENCVISNCWAGGSLGGGAGRGAQGSDSAGGHDDGLCLEGRGRDGGGEAGHQHLDRSCEVHSGPEGLRGAVRDQVRRDGGRQRRVCQQAGSQGGSRRGRRGAARHGAHG